MCSFQDKIENKTQATGYKVAVKIKDRYYSPVTGIEYKPGMVTIPTEQVLYISRMDDELLNPGSFAHEKKYKGLTAMFQKITSAKWQLMQWEDRTDKDLVILKMTIQKTKTRPHLYSGEYSNRKVYIGGRIRNMKEVKE